MKAKRFVVRSNDKHPTGHSVEPVRKLRTRMSIPMNPFDHRMAIIVHSHLRGDPSRLIQHQRTGSIEENLGHLSGGKCVGKFHWLKNVVISF
jgi:glutaminase